MCCVMGVWGGGGGGGWLNHFSSLFCGAGG